MDFFSVLTMIGGLALFLYGMHLMGDGLSKASGGRLESILEKLTSTPVKAVLVGAGVTAIIQSSSATTVMVVGFVNSGIMKLEQAVNVIIGANVGTTITAWLLSLSGIESSSFFIQLLKPSSFSPILAIIGVSLISFSKKDKQKDIGTIMAGFAILMIGMDTMSNAVKPLADVPEFTKILTMFSNPILGMLAGLILTAVIQSSSASVGILQALCKTGSVSYATAIPVIMGQNIGTCITAMISSVGASKDAKRAALLHLYYNILKTSLFMAVFYSINAFVHFPFMEQSISALGVAVVHSAFNIAACIILLPFSKLLVKLVYLTVPDRAKAEELSPEEIELRTLDARFLDTPGLAIERSKHVAVTMARYAQRSINIAMGLLQGYDAEKASEVEKLENQVDRFEDELGTYLVKLSSRNLSEKESHTLSVLLHCIGDFERISDHALNIKEAADEMNDKKLAFSDKATEEVTVFSNAISEILEIAISAFEKDDLNKAELVEPLEEVIDQLNIEIKKRHVKRLRKGKCTIELGFVLSDITTNYERVADHCSNIAVCLLQVSEDSFETHEYLDTLKEEDNMEFKGKVLAYREKYLLP
ncbi:MAG: Na/Pi cotransporter family protein [Lachnospiraceae bacterium]